MINTRRAFDPQLMGSGQMMPQPRPVGGGLSRLGGGLQRFREFAQANPAAVAALGAGIMSGNTAQGLAQFGQFAQANRRKKGIAEWVKRTRPDLAELADTNPDAALKIALSKGDTPNSFSEWKLAQENPEYGKHLSERMKASGTNITNNLGETSTAGNPKEGWELFTTPEGERRMRRIPGGPADLEYKADKRKIELTLTNLDAQRALVGDDIDTAISMIEANPDMTTGLIGGIIAAKPDTEAGQLKSVIGTIKANIGLDKLDQLRAASSSGASGLGALSENEMKLLTSVLGDIEQTNDPELLKRNLKRIKIILEKSKAARYAEYEKAYGDAWQSQAPVFEPYSPNSPVSGNTTTNVPFRILD